MSLKPLTGSPATPPSVCTSNRVGAKLPHLQHCATRTTFHDKKLRPKAIYLLGLVPKKSRNLSAILLCRLQCSTAMATTIPDMNMMLVSFRYSLPTASVVMMPSRGRKLGYPATLSDCVGKEQSNCLTYATAYCGFQIFTQKRVFRWFWIDTRMERIGITSE